MAERDGKTEPPSSPIQKARDYAAKAKEISEKLIDTQRKSKEFAKKVAWDESAKEYKEYDLDELEAEIERRVVELAKHREHAQKRREKEGRKLDKMMDRVIEESKKLNSKEEDLLEASLQNELDALKFEAKRLVDEIALQQRQRVKYAELTEHELLKAEQEARHSLVDLTIKQGEDWLTIENYLRYLAINKDLALRKAKALAGQLKMVQDDLNEKMWKLDALRVEWKEAEEVAEKCKNDILIAEHELQTLRNSDVDAHSWLERLRKKETKIHLMQEDEREVKEEILRAIDVIKEVTEKKIKAEHQFRKLCQKELDAAKWAEYLSAKIERGQKDLESEQELIAEIELQLAEAENEVQRVGEEKRKAKAEAVEFRKKAAEATAKAEKLAKEIVKERKEAQATVRKVVAGEHEAVKEAFELGKGIKN